MEDATIHPRPEPDSPIPFIEPDPAHTERELLRELAEMRAMMIRIETEVLSDEHGIIPDYPPRCYDEDGQQIPYTPEETQLRSEIFRRSMAAIDAKYQDPPGSDEEFMRAIDSNRPDGMKFFEGYY